MLITACASTPKFDTGNLDLSITPQRAADESKQLAGTGVLWGGMIINSTNLKDETQLEMLAYPLDSDQKPDIDQKPMGRFLAVRQGYMETTGYSQGRLVTVSGTLQENRRGRVGETEYTYPTVKIDKLHLWRTGSERGKTQFRIGIGVIFHN